MNTRSIEKWEHVSRRGAARFLAVLGVGVLGGVEFLANCLVPVLRGTVQFRPGEAFRQFNQVGCYRSRDRSGRLARL
jgi:hypothetical protein